MSPLEPPVNPSPSEAQIFEPFGEAFELMKRVLFQPFDLAKWCGIAFAAFLSGHFGGGAGISPPLPMGDFSQRGRFSDQSINFNPHDFPWLIGIGIVLGLLAFAFIIFLIWVRSRGIFIFTDCIVRNRAAITEPWREYRKEGNSYFGFTLLAMLLSVVVVLLFAGLFVGILWAIPEHLRVVTLISISVLAMAAWICLCVTFALINYFMPMIMYAQRCGAVQAFRESINLISTRPAPFFLFALFAVVLILALFIIGVAVTCATCCLASLPYIGTVIMLPALVWLRGFGLLFLRQFGADFDVWRDVPPTLPPTAPVPLA